MRTEAGQSIDSSNERLKVLEEELANPEFATRTDVSEAFGRLDSELEGGMQEIEQQIGVIFLSLSIPDEVPEFRCRLRDTPLKNHHQFGM
jgi:hypothetical protein